MRAQGARSVVAYSPHARRPIGAAPHQKRRARPLRRRSCGIAGSEPPTDDPRCRHTAPRAREPAAPRMDSGRTCVGRPDSRAPHLNRAGIVPTASGRRARQALFVSARTIASASTPRQGADIGPSAGRWPGAVAVKNDIAVSRVVHRRDGACEPSWAIWAIFCACPGHLRLVAITPSGCSRLPRCERRGHPRPASACARPPALPSSVRHPATTCPFAGIDHVADGVTATALPPRDRRQQMTPTRAPPSAALTHPPRSHPADATLPSRRPSVARRPPVSASAAGRISIAAKSNRTNRRRHRTMPGPTLYPMFCSSAAHHPLRRASPRHSPGHVSR